MEETALRKFVSEPTMSLMDVSTGVSTGVGDLGGYRENNPMSVASMPVYETGERTEKDKVAATQELERRGVAGPSVPSQQSVMAAPRSKNPFNPAFRETVRSALYDFLGASNIASAEPRSYARSKLADFVTGGTDFVPVLGDAIGAAETKQQFDAGNYGTAGLYGAATLIGATGIGKPVAKKIKKIANQSALRRFSGPEIQTAQAGRVVETPIMDVLNEKGYSINPFMAQTDLNVRPENISSGNYKGLVERYKNDPDYAMREQARLLGGRYTEPEDLFMQSGTYEDLIGNPLVILPADRTIRGKVDRIAGIDLDNPLMVEGGPGHADAWKNWMSSRSAAATKQAHINRVREATGKDPILIYSANLDEGSNYSVSPSFAAVEMISSTGGLNKNQIELLDRAIKKIPDSGDFKGIADSWSGYESPEQLIDWLFTESPRASAGKKRKAFMGSAVLAKKALTDAGFPIPKDIYSVVNEPSMRGMPKGFSGYRGMVTTDIAPEDLITDTTLNLSYDTIIPSQEAFALGGQMVPVDIMFKDPMQSRFDMGKNFHQAYRSLMTSGGKADYQMATPQWFDELNQYLESTKNLK